MRIRWLRELFNFSGKERTGIIVLLLIIFILLLIGWLIPRFFPADKNDFSKWQGEVNDYLTKKALDGIFLKTEAEELKIRKSVSARISPLLQKVFGSLDTK